ncbi:hypothetical protein ILFOPFJJ_06443 [Ensifer psoraleae]|nr:hypothetical protein [Sinorhizobium psoraleae]
MPRFVMLVRLTARSISFDGRLNQFRTCRHAGPPCHPSRAGTANHDHAIGSINTIGDICLRQCAPHWFAALLGSSAAPDSAAGRSGGWRRPQDRRHGHEPLGVSQAQKAARRRGNIQNPDHLEWSRSSEPLPQRKRDNGTTVQCGNRILQAAARCSGSPPREAGFKVYESTVWPSTLKLSTKRMLLPWHVYC